MWQHTIRAGTSALLGLVLFTSIAVSQEAERAQFIAPDEALFVGNGLLFPWESKRHRLGVYGPEADLSLNSLQTTSIKIDAMHKLPNPGQWLFSLLTADDLRGQLPELADPRDVIRFDGEESYTKFFCGETTLDPVPPNCNVDGIYLDGGEDGDLIVSFDQCFPLIRGVTYGPSDLVRYTRTDPNDCSDWSIAGLAFDSTGRVANNSNAVAIAWIGNNPLFAFDVQTDLATNAGDAQFVPGQIVTWDGSFFGLFENLPGWEPTTQVNALALPPATCANLGVTDPANRLIDTCAATWRNDAGQLRSRMEWRFENDAQAYNVYKGDLGGTAAPACLTPESISDRQFITTDNPTVGNAFYYLVSGVFPDGEGSLGQDGSGAERPNPSACGGSAN